MYAGIVPLSYDLHFAPRYKDTPYFSPVSKVDFGGADTVRGHETRKQLEQEIGFGLLVWTRSEYPTRGS